jgi:hypothetical protein
MGNDFEDSITRGALKLVDYFSALEGYEVYKNPELFDYSDYFDYKKNSGRRLLELYPLDIHELENKVPALITKFLSICLELNKKKMMECATSIKLITHTLTMKSIGSTEQDILDGMEYKDFDAQEYFLNLMFIKYDGRLESDTVPQGKIERLEWYKSKQRVMNEDEINEMNRLYFYD